MPAAHASVESYLAALPEDRRSALRTVLGVVRASIDPGYREGIQYNMIGFFVPHEVYPPGYHCDPKQPVPFLALASQKSHMAVYFFGLYVAPDPLQGAAQMRAFQDAWRAAGKRLDMGKSCIRFRSVDDLALDVLAEAIRALPVRTFLERYTASIPAGRKPATARARPVARGAPTPSSANSATKPAARPRARGKVSTKATRTTGSKARRRTSAP
jgi:hypothetical protein